MNNTKPLEKVSQQALDSTGSDSISELALIAIVKSLITRNQESKAKEVLFAYIQKNQQPSDSIKQLINNFK